MQAEDPAKGIPFCYGVPCGPDYMGVQGYCQPYQLGAYKATVGPDQCTSCHAGTHGRLPASNGSDACLACPTGSASVAWSSGCACVLGYALFRTKSISSLQYRPSTKQTSCIQCTQGSGHPPLDPHIVLCARKTLHKILPAPLPAQPVPRATTRACPLPPPALPAPQ